MWLLRDVDARVNQSEVSSMNCACRTLGEQQDQDPIQDDGRAKQGHTSSSLTSLKSTVLRVQVVPFKYLVLNHTCESKRVFPLCLPATSWKVTFPCTGLTLRGSITPENSNRVKVRQDFLYGGLFECKGLL
jgi:hypothetical protein